MYSAHLSINEINADIEKDFSLVPFCQSYWYANAKRSSGHTVYTIVIKNEEGDEELFARFFDHSLRGTMRYLYAPYGPVVKDEEKRAQCEEKLVHFIRSQKELCKYVFVRCDTLKGDANIVRPQKRLLKLASLQPRREWVTDLSVTKEELFAEASTSQRRAIRLGERGGVTIDFVHDDILASSDVFHDLMKDTSARNKFTLHDKEYYNTLMKEMSESHSGYLAVARYDNVPVCVALTSVYKGEAMFLFGASASHSPGPDASAYLHFENMCHAKEGGALTYSFGGVSAVSDVHHPWSGLSAFKRKFPGEERTHFLTGDIAMRPFLYLLLLCYTFFVA